MTVAENIATVRRFYASGRADDDSERVPFFAPDVVWHAPGENPVSGLYRGSASILADMAARMQPLDRWDLDLRHIMGNDDLVVTTLGLVGDRRGRHIETEGAHVFRFDREGRIVEAWGFTADQAGLDAFFSA